MGEKKEIRISVKDKIACLVDKEQFLVCGNNDYNVIFDFDSDWEGINAKTAVFVYGNTPIHQPFVGNVCEGVEIKNATLCAIGVFAGNIKTTTGATIECRQSIRDIGGVPKPPSKEVYDEIMALLDKAIEAHTELPTGGKKGQVLKKVSDKDYDTAWENDEQRDLTEIEESLANKLDKTTEADKIYGTDAEGNQTTLPVDTFAKRKAHNPNFYTALGYGATPEETTFIMSGGATPNSIVFRDGSGNFKVNTPTDDSHPAPKGYVVAKTTTPSRLYGTNANGAQTLHQFSQSVIPWFIATRSERGELFVPYTPYADSEATSKQYVDGLVNPLEERVSDLESLTLTYTEDKATAYNKPVPANVGKYALIKSVGGATKKVVVSKNILNPRDIDIQGGAEDIVYNDDGSITLTIPYNSIIIAVLPQLPTKTYGMYWDNNHFDSLVRLPTEDSYDYGVKGWNTFNATYGRVELELGNMDWNNEGEEAHPPVSVTFKVAVFDDTTEQPYEPFREGFINAEVSKIESRGANLITFPYVYDAKVKDVGYKETTNGVTFEVLENGLISAIGTATAVSTFQIFKKIMPEGNYYLSGKYTSGGTLIGSYNYGTPNYTVAQNGIGTINQEFTHAGGMFGAYIKIDSGVTVNSVFSPIITKDYYVSEFKPYHAEPIDTFTIPESVKSNPDYGKGIDSTDYNYIECIDGKWQYVQKCKELVLNGTENWWLQSVNTHGIANFGFNITAIATGSKGLCSDRDYDSSLISNATRRGLHIGTDIIYIRDDVIKTLAEWKTHLANRYANGNPIRILYKLLTPKVSDITEAFTNGYKIQVQQGGTLIPVNENEIPVPTTIAYVTRKE